MGGVQTQCWGHHGACFLVFFYYPLGPNLCLQIHVRALDTPSRFVRPQSIHFLQDGKACRAAPCPAPLTASVLGVSPERHHLSCGHRIQFLQSPFP